MPFAIAKFHAKTLDRSENIPKKFYGGGLLFLKHPVLKWLQWH